jgi:hypothetical protein
MDLARLPALSRLAAVVALTRFTRGALFDDQEVQFFPGSVDKDNTTASAPATTATALANGVTALAAIAGLKNNARFLRGHGETGQHGKKEYDQDSMHLHFEENEQSLASLG